MQANQPKPHVLKIDGMHCAACQAPIERALRAVAGVAQININLAEREVYVEGIAAVGLLVSAVAQAGYAAEIIPNDSYEDTDQALEQKARGRTSRAIRRLLDLQKKTARAIRAGKNKKQNQRSRSARV